MKTKLLLFTLFISAMSFAQYTAIPDANFENYLETHDSNGNTVTVGDATSMGNGIANDNYVTTASINTINALNIAYKNISDLTGIEDFSALTQLICSHNLLTSLDLSQNLLLTNLQCNNNQIESLDLSLNSQIVYLSCETNQLTSLNIKNGNNINFTGFIATSNPNLTCIEVDNPTYSTANWIQVDASSVFSSNCGATMPCLNFNFILDTNNNFDGASQGDIVYGDIDSDNDLDIVFCGFQNGSRTTKLYINDGIGNFTINTTNSFTGVVSSFLKLIDVDGDLDLDLFICGSSSSGVISNLYINDGLGNYTLDTANNFITGYNASFSDIDGDGDEDLLIMDTSNNALYKNDGNGLFTMVSNTNFNNFHLGTIDFKDFNNDGYKDLILTGNNSNIPRPTELYFNDGNGNFTMVSNTGLVSCGRSAIAFSDTNNDGYLDILITGKDGSQTLLAKLFINNGNGTFSEVSNTPFDPCYNGTVEFADLDNDGDDDVLITGQNVLNQLSPSIAKVYENLGNNSFVLKTSLQGVVSSGSICADLNNDNFIDIVNIGYTGQSSFYLYFNECATASINEFDFNKNLSIYPNPTKNQVTIKTDRLSTYKIYNITGQIIKKGELINGKNNLNINSLNQGVYFVKVTDNHTEITKKLIIK